MISPEDRLFFESEGYLLIRNFFDYETDILPIQRDIFEIIHLVAERHGLDLGLLDAPDGWWSW